MEYVYSAMVLHAAKKPVTEEGVTKVLKAAGVEPDAARVKALTAALEGVNIDEAIATAVAAPVAAAPAAAGPAEKKEEKKEEKKK
jgi:large subunit ribosomal protein L12